MWDFPLKLEPFRGGNLVFVNDMLRPFSSLKEITSLRNNLQNRYEEILVPRPGFEPGARARKARMFDRATPPGPDIREGRAFKNLSSGFGKPF